jgi:hypothetical protein
MRKNNVAINQFGGRGALVSDVEATTIRLLLVLSHVPTSIATITSPEAVAGREGAEAVEDEEEDEEEG